MNEDLQIEVSWRESNGAANTTPFNQYVMPFNELHMLTEKYDYTFNTYKDGVRNNSNFLYATAIVADADGKMNMHDAKDVFKDTKNVLIVTSKSHKSDFKISEYGTSGKAIESTDRFHIIIALPKPITDATIYRQVMKNLIAQYPIDPACKDPGRFFFPNKSKQIHWYS